MKNNKILLIIILALIINFSFFLSAILAEDKPPELQNQSAVQVFPKLPTTPNDPHLKEAKVYPMWGPTCQRYTYSVVYQDEKNRPPEYVRMYFNGSWLDLKKENENDKDYQKGVRYIYKFVPNKLGSNFYFFEASNGLGKARDGIIDSPDNGPVLFDTDFSKNEIALINPESGEKVWSYPTNKEWVKGIALSDDGQYLAALSTRHIYLFNSRNNKPIWKYESKDQMALENNDVKGGIDISGDGSKIFALIGPKALLFNKKSQKPLWEYNTDQQGYNAAISRDGNYMAVGTAGDEQNIKSNLIILWKASSSKPLWQYHSSGNFHDVSLSDDGLYIAAATGCPDRRAYIFSKDSKEPILKSEMLTEDSPVNRAKISADGQFVAFSAEYNKGLVFFFKNPKFGGSNKPLWQMASADQHRSGRALAMTPNQQTILETTFAGEVMLLGPNSNKIEKYWQVPKALAAADISDDGQIIAVGGVGKKVYLFDRNTEKSKAEISFSEYISEIDISAGGQYVAAGTGGANYFFETIYPDEKTETTCTKITEPEPDPSNLENSNNLNQATNQSGPSQLLIIIFSILLILAIVFSILFWRFRKLWLLIVALIFLICGIIFVVVQRPSLAPKRIENNLETQTSKNKTDNATDTSSDKIETTTDNNSTIENTDNSTKVNQGSAQDDSGQTQPVCGNGLCEPNLSETRETCPKDCSSDN